MPFVEQRANSGYSIVGGRTYPQGEAPIAQIQVITPGYFATVRTPVRQGRDFTDDDQYGRPQVAIVNERLVREAFGDTDPMGRVITTGMTMESMNGMRIVGVVADARQLSPATPPQPEIYLPYLQHPGPGSRLALVTDTSLDPDSLVASIREAARKLNPDVPVRFSTMDDSFRLALSYPRFRTVLVAAFAFLAVALALVGIYSVLSYLVAEQTQEIGVRLALGALRRDIFGAVIGGSMRLVFSGLVIGVVGALLGFERREAGVLMAVEDARRLVETFGDFPVEVRLRPHPDAVLRAIAQTETAAGLHQQFAERDALHERFEAVRDDAPPKQARRARGPASGKRERLPVAGKRERRDHALERAGGGQALQRRDQARPQVGSADGNLHGSDDARANAAFLKRPYTEYGTFG